jgi:hypothetical protein
MKPAPGKIMVNGIRNNNALIEGRFLALYILQIKEEVP